MSRSRQNHNHDHVRIHITIHTTIHTREDFSTKRFENGHVITVKA